MDWGCYEPVSYSYKESGSKKEKRLERILRTAVSLRQFAPKLIMANFSSSICGVKASRLGGAEDRVGSLPIAFGNQTISQNTETHGFAVLASQRVCLYRVQSLVMKYPTVPVGADWYCQRVLFQQH
jgi:hypothetical protein